MKKFTFTVELVHDSIDEITVAGILKSAIEGIGTYDCCLLYTSPSPRDLSTSRMPSSA